MPSTPGVFLPLFDVTRFTAMSLAWNECVRSHCKAFILPGFPSKTAFAIRICSLRTLRNTSFQIIECHIFASSTRAPALWAVICVLILRRFSKLSYKEAPVGRQQLISVPVERQTRLLSLNHVADSIHPITGWHLLLPTSPNRSSIGLPYGWLAMHCTWRSIGLTTFRFVHPVDDLGAFSTPEVQRFRTCSYQTCNLTIRCKHREAAFDLIILVGLFSFTALANIQLISPYHPSRALTGEDFLRGLHVTNPTQFDPLSTGLRTDHTARGKHARIGTGRNIPGIQILYSKYKPLNTLNKATSCRTITQSSPARLASGETFGYVRCV
ncbi:hypothetical protein MHK_006651 [Candidatus Magnetomorum sp. HK-1]|nr:hypothetical protein MHK_006651 [Candidatus Magnetomorum sp. HK-1]